MVGEEVGSSFLTPGPSLAGLLRSARCGRADTYQVSGTSVTDRINHGWVIQSWESLGIGLLAELCQCL